MKVSIRILIFSHLLVFCIGYYLAHKGHAAKHGIQVEETTNSTKIEDQVTNPAPKLDTVYVPPIGTTRIYGPQVKLAPQAVSKSTVQINLSEDIVSRMESQWNDLTYIAEAKRDVSSWTLTYVKVGSIFSEAGFRSGDILRDQVLETAVASSEELRGRVRQIFDRITR